MSYTYFPFQNSRNETTCKDSLSNGCFMDTLTGKSYYFIGNFAVILHLQYKVLVSQSALG